MIRGKKYLWKVFVLGLLVVSCSWNEDERSSIAYDSIEAVESYPEETSNQDDVLNLKTKVGAASLEKYLPQLKGKKVALVGNHTSKIDDVFLVDTLLALGVDLSILFAPEHGFRGDKQFGAKIDHSVDPKTGLRIFSLHGKTKKPTKESLDSVDIILFDIQDVGARFYTYISTLHYVMEAAAELDKGVIILDRPNPNAHYVDGPVLDTNFKSFVGMHPVPVVYGMTIGEYGRMINGQYWLKDSLQAKLAVVPLEFWSHEKEYILPIAPSPNLPNQLSVYLYPSLCFFEGTEISVGRGTDFPFQVWGHPNADCETLGDFSFTPISMPGKSKYPKHENKICKGNEFKSLTPDAVRSNWQLEPEVIYEALNCVRPEKEFINRLSFFNLLAGNSTFAKQLKSGMSPEAIKKSWQPDLDKFKQIRNLYLIYP